LTGEYRASRLTMGSEANGELEGDGSGATAQVKRAAKHDSGVADLEKVTDYAEEKEISSDDILGAISLIQDKRSKETMEKAERERELGKVTILKEHVDLIVRILLI
jgi:hypothetical protein